MAGTEEHDEEARDRLGEAESSVYLSLVASDSQRPWSLHELGLEVGDHGRAVDAVRHLRATGLVHECNGYAWATRAALAADGIGV